MSSNATRCAIRAEGLGKAYTLGARAPGAGSLREALHGLVSAPLRRLRELSRGGEGPEYWALEDLDLSVAPGEVVGIVGHNGAGKSTLLKILSRITAPTTGRVEIAGRVASLLEVGTGFHPELTGRENIVLNGTILGMSRRDIRARFDAIAGFAELSGFLDTPVKRYSSGMYVRLAFAVAAHVDADVLIVDEVLAVGDAAFQRKCLGTLEASARSGRTVLLVSHNMNAVRRLCTRALHLREGRVVFDGDVDAAIQSHLADQRDGSGDGTRALGGAGHRHLAEARIEDANGEPAALVDYEQPCAVRVRYSAPPAPQSFLLALRVSDELGNVLFTSWDTDTLTGPRPQPRQRAEARCTIPGALLKPGGYTVSVLMRVREQGEFVHDEHLDLRIAVNDLGIEAGRERLGLLAPRLQWTMSEARDAAP